MANLSFEDLPAGKSFRYGAYRVTAEEIVSFAREFDPQSFHVAAASKDLIASGWHTSAMAMRMTCDGFLLDADGMGSPGVEDVRWLKPVRPGMILSTQVDVTGARVSKSRPEMGLVSFSARIHDQTGLDLMTQRYTAMFGRRDPRAPTSETSLVSPVTHATPPEPPIHDDEAINRTRFAARYEDAVIGARLSLGSHAFIREDMLRFARAYDPQPFHLDDAAAARSHFGKLAASGWHTASAYMGRLVETRNRLRDAARARGEPVRADTPSPGFHDLRWLRPVFVGDTIAYDTTLVGKRPSSRPGFGKVIARARGFNQDGRQVYQSFSESLIQMRE